jgi:alanine racemase
MVHRPSTTPRIHPLTSSLRPTYAEVDLGAIAHNLRAVQQLAGSASVLAVVKADAYGHGVVPVAHALERAGVHGFGVALAEEGLELRQAGIRATILVLNGVYSGAAQQVLRAGLTPVVHDESNLRDLAVAAGGEGFELHLKVDTGMSRLGVQVAHLEPFLAKVAATPGARITGLMTHLAAADSDPWFTAHQLRRFGEAAARVRAAGHRSLTLHAANSAGTFLAEARFDMVRPGLCLYGVSPLPWPLEIPLRPALRLRTEIIAIRELEVGDTVGYDRTFVVERPGTRIATVPVGYGDGLLWRSSGRGAMLVAGQRAPIAGRVSMDLTTLDVTHVPSAAVGDEVVMLGRQAEASLDARDLAEAADSTAYEVLTSISRRVPRIYRQ